MEYLTPNAFHWPNGKAPKMKQETFFMDVEYTDTYSVARPIIHGCAERSLNCPLAYLIGPFPVVRKRLWA